MHQVCSLAPGVGSQRWCGCPGVAGVRTPTLLVCHVYRLGSVIVAAQLWLLLVVGITLEDRFSTSAARSMKLS
jgi:hypothetical protein